MLTITPSITSSYIFIQVDCETYLNFIIVNSFWCFFVKHAYNKYIRMTGWWDTCPIRPCSTKLHSAVSSKMHCREETLSRLVVAVSRSRWENTPDRSCEWVSASSCQALHTINFSLEEQLCQGLFSCRRQHYLNSQDTSKTIKIKKLGQEFFKVRGLF